MLPSYIQNGYVGSGRLTRGFRVTLLVLDYLYYVTINDETRREQCGPKTLPHIGCRPLGQIATQMFKQAPYTILTGLACRDPQR